MNQQEFQKLYVQSRRQPLTAKQIAAGAALRLDWDTFDQLQASCDPDRTISKEDALQDIADLFLLLRYCYSGYEYFFDSLTLSALESELRQQVSALPSDSISSLALCQLFHRVLRPYINDGHLALQYADFEGLFFTPYYPYVTDLLVEEVGDDLRVIRGTDSLPAGTRLRRDSVTGTLYPTLSPLSHNRCYLIGCYTPSDPIFIDVAGYPQKTHLLKCCLPTEVTSTAAAPALPYELTTHSNYSVFTNRSYQLYENEDFHKQEFYRIGRLCSASDITILDLSHNRGGSSRYPELFIRGLNGYARGDMDTAVLCSPIIGNAESLRYYQIKKSPDFDLSQSTYTGTLYVITNKETGSSAENACMIARSCQNMIFLGSPTAGIGLFGDVRPYRLPRSGITLILPYKIFYEDEFEIGQGKYPDYWLDNDRPVEYLLECLGAKEPKERPH